METTAATRRRFADLRRPLRALVACAVVLISLVSIGSTNAMTLTASASGATYYVSSTGSDANACTQAAPCKTLQHSISLAQPGDAVNVAPGTYPGETITAVKSSPGVVVYAAGATFGPLVTGGSWYTIDNLTIDTGTVHGAGGWTAPPTSSYITMNNLKLHGLYPSVHPGGSFITWDGGEMGVAGQDPAQAQRLCSTRDTEPITSEGSGNANNITIENVHIHPQGSSTTPCTGSSNGFHLELIRIDYGAHDWLVKNVVFDAGSESSTATVFVTRYGGTVDPYNLTFENDYFGKAAPGDHGGIDFGTNVATCSNFHFINNSFESATGSETVNGGCASAPGLEWIGNAGARTTTAAGYPCMGLHENNVWQNDVSYTCGNDKIVIGTRYATDKLGYTGDNGHTLPTSVLVGAGEPAANGPSADFEGDLRPTPGYDDAGADQQRATPVPDTTPPVLANLPQSQTLEATGPGGAIATYVPPTATDNVDPSPAVSCVPASGSTFPLGTTTVTCTARDASANTSSATFQIVVRDTTPPALSLPGNQTLQAGGPGGTIGSFTVAATDLVDPKPAVTCSPISGSMFPIGTTPVQCSATDASGNTASGTFNVAVVDTTAPTAPLSPAVANVTTTGASLIWSPSTDAVGVTGYNLWLDGNAAGTTTASGYAFGGLACGTTHTLTVAAHDAAGNTSGPASATVTTSACSSPAPAPPPSTSSSPTPAQIGLLNRIPTSGSATDTMTVGPIHAGDTVLVAVAGNGYQPSGVKDGRGNGYVLDATSGAANAASSTAVYRFRYATALSSTTLTLTWTGPLDQHQAAAYAVPSLVATPLDAHAAAGAKTTAPTISAPASKQVNEVALAAFRINELSWAGSGWVPSGWTGLTNVFAASLVGHFMVAYKLMPSTATASLGFSLGGTARYWSSVVATYVGS
jgi:HYR domain-containing protein/uncharacterized protein DUF1565